MKYDFSPINSTVTAADIVAIKKIYQTNNNKVITIIAACFAGFIMVFAFANFAVFLLRQDNGLLSVLISFFVILVLISFSIFIGLRYQKKIWEQNVRLYRFAQVNKMSFKLKIIRPGYDGMIFNIGDGRTASNVFSSSNGEDFEIGNYTYSVTSGSGKDRHTTYYNYGYIMITLTKNLPHMVLDSKANNASFFGANLSNLPAFFDKDQKLSLEGDFDKYFTLYAPKEYEQDALFVFSPELMAMFIDESSKYDAEIIDDKLFIYSSKHFDFSNILLVQQLFDIIQKVGKAVVHNTENYNDEMVGDRTANIITESGRRLKTSVPIFAIIFFVIFMAFIFFNLIWR